MKELFGLENKTVVITGGSGGVGQASALLFAKVAGAKVALLSRRGADSVVEEIEEAGGTAKSYQVDITDRSGLDKTFQNIVNDLGPVQSLLNISGTCDFYSEDMSPVERAKIDDQRWQRIVDVNGKGPALAIQMALKSMPEGGSIVNVASTAGRYGAELAVIDYTFSKAGLVGMTMGYAKILGSKGIRVNCVAPGPIAGTEMLADADQQTVDQMKATTRLGRLSSPEDIANVNLFLASSQSSIMTGATVDANAGQFISA